MIKNYFDWNKETDRMVEFTESAPQELRGKKLPILAGSFPNFAIRFDYKVDLQTLNVISTDDPSYKKSTHPTLNDLMLKGIIKEWFPYKLADLDSAERMQTENGELDVPAIIGYFKMCGLNVSEEAILHNYDAWCAGFKSGYRDEANGTHVFSPCGGWNPFNIHVTSLYESCKDWQTTYEC